MERSLHDLQLELFQSRKIINAHALEIQKAEKMEFFDRFLQGLKNHQNRTEVTPNDIEIIVHRLNNSVLLLAQILLYLQSFYEFSANTGVICTLCGTTTFILKN